MMLLGTGHSHPEQRAVIHPRPFIDQILIFFMANAPENLFLSRRDWVVSALYGLWNSCIHLLVL